MIGGSSILVSACSNQASKSDPGGAKAPDQKEPVELVFYSQVPDYDETFMDTFGSKIQAKYPHITVKHKPAGSNKLDTMITNGDTIDVLFMSIGQADSLIQYGLQNDISEYMAKSKFDLSRLEQTAVELQKGFANGGMYGLPVFTNTLALFYNKDLFSKFGVAAPKDGMTWSEVYDLAKRMSRTDEGTQYYGLAMSSSANFALNQFGASYIDLKTRKAAFTSEPFRKTMELLAGVSNIPGNGLNAQNWSLGPQQKLFPDGKAAMFLHFAVYGLSNYKDALNWDVVSYPQLPDKPGMGAQTYPTYFYVTKTSKHKQEAFDAIAYLTSEEFQNHLARKGMLPILKNRVAGMAEFGKEVPYLKDKNVKSLIPEKFAPSQFTSVDVVRAQTPGHTFFFNAYQKAVLGQEDMNTALRSEGEKLDQKLAELFK
ncbi:sugar ABC transporter substrate-binding protein [Paenibacillus hodogayensis]